MLLTKYDPLKQQSLQVLDKDGNIVNKQLEPKLDNDKLLEMYRLMSLGRIADIMAVQFQRQGRMRTFAPNQGQEAAPAVPYAPTPRPD